jgi:hypothetical protein
MGIRAADPVFIDHIENFELWDGHQKCQGGSIDTTVEEFFATTSMESAARRFWSTSRKRRSFA